MPDAQAKNSPIKLILHPERETYSVGESIRPRLEIQNQSASPVEISGFEFNWDALAFSAPNAAHLMGPDGQDKLLPYRQPASFTGSGSPLRVEGGKSEWLYLPISHYLHLRQFGRYVFWVELLDDFGTLHRSNQIGFQLFDLDAALPPELIALTLQATKASFAAGEPVYVEAVFTNRADQPLIFLQPQQDSFDGWVNPVYQFTVIDSAGRGLALARRSGSMATPVYDDANKFTVEPGQSFQLYLRLPVFPEMKRPGEYRVRLTYLVRNQAIGKGGDVLDKPMNWEQGVFTGRVESNEVVLSIV